MEIVSISDVYMIAKKRPKEVVFKIPELSNKENDAWETRFNDLLSECGCTSGQQFIRYSTPGLVIVLVILINYSDLSRQFILGIFVFSVILAGASGKIIGLLQRNYRIKKLVDELMKTQGV